MCTCVCAKKMSIFTLEFLWTMWKRRLYIHSLWYEFITEQSMSVCLKSGDVHVSVSYTWVIWAQL